MKLDRWARASQSVRDFAVVGGELAHLTKSQFVNSKQNIQNGNIDKQNHHQKRTQHATTQARNGQRPCWRYGSCNGFNERIGSGLPKPFIRSLVYICLVRGLQSRFADRDCIQAV
jgi:hypothetical protein